VQFLAGTRGAAFAATAAHQGAPAAGPIRLWRGVRHSEADAFRLDLRGGLPTTLVPFVLTSYSLSEGAARGFARKRIRSVARGAQSSGLVYFLDVAVNDFVFVENAELCDQLLVEEEVLVLHNMAVAIGQPNIVDDAVPVAAF
jgi:hypothetical protein